MSLNSSNTQLKNNVIFLCVIFILNTIFIITRINAARLVLAGVIILYLLSAKKEFLIPSIFFIHSCSASFDTAGFTYIFNISIFIVAVRLLLFRNLKVNKKIFLCILLILMQELIMDAVYGKLDRKIITLAGWISGYLIIAVEARYVEEKDFDRIVQFMFWGYVVGFIQGLSIPIIKWGLSWPTAYRFTGMLRDPNYYSLNAILLINCAYLYEKKNKVNRFLIIIPVIVMGMFSVSKMFLGLAVVSIIMQEIFVPKKVKAGHVFISIVALAAFLLIAIKYGLFDLIIKKFLYRFDTVTLTTGRNVLFMYYANKLLSNPLYLLFGVGMLGYRGVLNSVADLGNQFGRYVAHNTYLDLLCSWGLTGTLVYLLFVLYLNKCTETHSNEKHDNSFRVTALIFAAGVFSLSYLAADVFAILLLFIFTFKKASVIDSHQSLSIDNRKSN